VRQNVLPLRPPPLINSFGSSSGAARCTRDMASDSYGHRAFC
jgi:hypothetical protein